MWCIAQTQTNKTNLYFTIEGKWELDPLHIRLFMTEELANKEWARIHEDKSSGWNRANPLSVMKV